MKRSAYIAFLAIFAMMAFFCYMTPWVYDDFGYGSGEGTFLGMFASQLAEHNSWSGKFVGHFLARVILHAPAWLHPVLTPLIFIILLWSSLILCFGSNSLQKADKQSQTRQDLTGYKLLEGLHAWHVIVLCGLIWFAVPGFGTVFFWRTGTPDYGYSLTWVTLFLVPYRLWLDKRDFWLPGGFAYCLMGFLAGCSNENIGMLAILLSLAVCAINFRAYKHLPAWAVGGLLGALIGWAFMMGAPGSAARLAKIGGSSLIPLLSANAFEKFLIFYETQQLELLPLTLPSLFFVWQLWRQGQVRKAIPGILFLLMSQACLAAFILSPSTPVRAMTATFFYATLSLFSLVVASGITAKRAGRWLIACFCLLFCISVAHEIRVFVLAQPAIAERDHARTTGTLSASHFDYPLTDKYFFATYDIKEIEGARGRFELIPWEKAETIQVGQHKLKALVISNMLFLDNLPVGQPVQAAGAGYGQTVSFNLQWLIRKLFPLEDMSTTSTEAITLRYLIASGLLNGNSGQAMIHLRGVTSLKDVAYIAIREKGKPRTWQRVMPVAID